MTRVVVPLLLLVASTAITRNVDASPPARDTASAARCDLGIIAAQDGDLARAETLFASLLSGSRRDARGLTNLGNVELLRGDPVLALTYYEQAIAADSTDPGIRLNRAMALTYLGDEQASGRAFQSAVDMAGGVTSAGALLGMRPDSVAVEDSRGAPGRTLTKQEVWLRLRQKLPPPAKDSTRASPSTAKRQPWDPKLGPAGPRAAQAEAASALYWKR